MPQKPLRVLMLNNEFPPLGGGTGVVTKELFDCFTSDSELHIDLVTSSMTRGLSCVEQYASNLVVHKVSCPSANIHHSSASELLMYAFNAWRYAEGLVSENVYDCSFAFSTVPAGAISYFLKLRRGLPYINSLQGPDIPGFEVRYRYLYPFLGPLLRRVWRSAEVCLAISEQQLALAKSFSTDASFQIIPNGVSPRFEPNATRSKGQIFRIICVGRLIRRKGQEYLLRAIEALTAQGFRNVELSLVGTGDDEMRLRALAQKLGIDKLVRFLGQVDQSSMPELYQMSDVFILPSQHEGMSIALLEALASGLPVVVTNTGGTRELVEEGKNGMIIEFGSVDSIVFVLKRLIGARKTCELMGRVSTHKAREYSWPVIAARYKSLFRSVAEC